MKELFRKEVLHIEHGAHSWQEAIRVVGRIMLEVGSIKEGYIQAMIDAVEELGPYIVIAPHMAIPHAAARENVLKNYMVIAVFQ
ncbi:MAG: PTS sugar transporter subunit IIA, partial [Clostridiales bacterium]|nr:PTS sugar transporter subunit IIA [Clostridiales bacterium]